MSEQIGCIKFSILGTLPALLLVSVVVGCHKDPREQSSLQQSKEKKEQALEATAESSEDEKEAAPGLTPKAIDGNLPAPVVLKDVGFFLPGSVVVDEERDVYLVSNANENPNGPENNGFISRVSPEGKLEELKWIEGGRGEVTLISPKGMAIRKDVLYVADIDVVRKFDVASGAPEGKVAVGKATFLNDIALAPNGVLYVTDTGFDVDPEDGKLVSNKRDAIFAIDDKDNVSTLVEGTLLNQPNGVIADEKGLHVVSWSRPELYAVSWKGEVSGRTGIPATNLDGLVRLPDGHLLVTSWITTALLEGMPGGLFRPMITGLVTPADLAYDAKRRRIVIPLARDNSLYIQPLS